jgi:hypothetical protein
MTITETLNDLCRGIIRSSLDDAKPKFVNGYPALRHKNCQDTECQACLEDHKRLEVHFANAINRRADWLGEYHGWLSDNGIKNETEFGWASSEAFDPKNIQAFIEEQQHGDR